MLILFIHPSIQLLYTSGIIFMSATEEQIALMAAANVSHVSYILLLYSISFLLFLFVCMLLHLYATHAFPLTSKSNNVLANGLSEESRNDHSNARIARDAEEFELEGLMSDEEEEGGRGGGGGGMNDDGKRRPNDPALTNGIGAPR